MSRGWNFPLPSQPQFGYGYYISYVHVTEHKGILPQIASEAIWEVYKFKFIPGGHAPKPPSVGMHAFHTLLTKSSCYHPVSPPPPTQNPVWNPDEVYKFRLQPYKLHPDPDTRTSPGSDFNLSTLILTSARTHCVTLHAWESELICALTIAIHSSSFQHLLTCQQLRSTVELFTQS